MTDKLNFNQQAGVGVVRKRSPQPGVLNLGGKFQIEHYRNGKCIGTYDIKNGITNEGKDDLLDVAFDGSTQHGNWYIGLVDNSGFSAFAAGDTAAQIGGTNGWSEYTSYSESNRVEWAPDAASSQSITNSTARSFNITGTSDTLKGIFIISDNTKSGTTGVLWSTASFSSTVPVTNGDELKITYTLNA